MTAGAALAGAAEWLGTRLDAELLLAHVLDVSRSTVVARDDRILTPEEQGDFETLIARRLAGEPLAYLTGTKEFWSLELAVSKHVLVPRPETELLVEWGLELAKIPPSPPFAKGGEDVLAPFAKGGRAAGAGGFAVLDIGTGSGAIALAIARECPQAAVVATDVSVAALAVARRNAKAHRIVNVTFVEADFLKLDSRFRGNDGNDVTDGHDGARQFDLIVSNPPYVAENDPHLADLRFEPALALTSGADGLDALRAIVADAPRHLRAGGWLLVEHGAEQGTAVRELFAAAGFDAIRTRRDLAGHERATGGQRVPAGSARGPA